MENRLLDHRNKLRRLKSMLSIQNAAANDANGDGVIDGGGVTALGRGTGGAALQPISENIQAIEFLYTLKPLPNGTIPPPTTSPTAAQLSDIRTITISILARAGTRDAKFVNTSLYTPASGIMWDLNGISMERFEDLTLTAH